SKGTPFSNWKERAKSWQDQHPMAKKGEWHVADARASPRAMRCFNCGENANHFSNGCPNARKVPDAVVIAALAGIQRPPPTPPAAAMAELTVAAATLIGDDESGNEDDE
ncbi:hypothetical protein JCM5296_004957, partial [Sporobolomyces johnsonii]